MLQTIEKVGLRWLLRFRKLDMTQPEQRQALVDTFINAIYLYDDKVLITFNYKEGTETVAFGEAMKAEKSSDMSARGAPQQNPNFFPAQTAYRKDAVLIGTIFENCDKNSKGTEYPRGKPVPLPFSIILHRALLLRYHSAGRCSRDGYSQSQNRLRGGAPSAWGSTPRQRAAGSGTSRIHHCGSEPGRRCRSFPVTAKWCRRYWR